MTSNALMKHFLFILLLLKTGGTAMATEQHNPQPPVPPAAPTTPNHQGQANTQSTVQHFTHHNQNISMQITGATPVITDQARAPLSFASGSSIQITMQGTNGTDPVVIRWDSTDCVATEAGESRPCHDAEREQILHLIRQLPTPPTQPGL